MKYFKNILLVMDGDLSNMLALKQAHPLPTQGPMPAGFDFALARDQQCPK